MEKKIAISVFLVCEQARGPHVEMNAKLKAKIVLDYLIYHRNQATPVGGWCSCRFFHSPALPSPRPDCVLFTCKR